MTTSAQLIWLLAACAALCAPTIRASAMRPDPRFTLLSGGLVGLACVAVAATSAPAGW